MKGGQGIENPAFVNSSPDTPRRFSASPSYVEVSAWSDNTQKEDSRPPDLPVPSATTPGSRERSGPGSLTEFEEGPCGWGSFQPHYLQLCNTPQGFLVHYCLLALTQGKVQRQLARAWAPGRARRGAESRGQRGQVRGEPGGPRAPRGRPRWGLASARTHINQLGSHFHILASLLSQNCLKLALLFFFFLWCSTSV